MYTGCLWPLFHYIILSHIVKKKQPFTKLNRPIVKKEITVNMQFKAHWLNIILEYNRWLANQICRSLQCLHQLFEIYMQIVQL